MAACFLFTTYSNSKEVALIHANMLNMACRIGWAAFFIRSWFNQRAREESKKHIKQAWTSMVPPSSVLAVFAISALAIRVSATRLSMVEHLGLGVACALACATTMYVAMYAFSSANADMNDSLATERRQLMALKVSLRP